MAEEGGILRNWLVCCEVFWFGVWTSWKGGMEGLRGLWGEILA